MALPITLTKTTDELSSADLADLVALFKSRGVSFGEPVLSNFLAILQDFADDIVAVNQGFAPIP